MMEEIEPPKQLICPLTSELFRDPVTASSGHVYERATIEEWLRHHDTDPKTNVVLPTKQLMPAFLIRELCDEWWRHFHELPRPQSPSNI